MQKIKEKLQNNLYMLFSFISLTCLVINRRPSNRVGGGGLKANYIVDQSRIWEDRSDISPKKIALKENFGHVTKNN